jgi:poly(A) polymerase
MTEREFAIAVVQRLRDEGYQALWAGGCVRDELLGLVPKDYDVATDARPEQVRALFRRHVAVGESFGVVKVFGPRRPKSPLLEVEVATFRNDGAYIDGRRPSEVVFSSPQEDAQRRDFTVNGMFFDPLESRLIDYVGGQADLQRRVLRAIGAPELRFREDKLRLLRAVRIATRFELQIEPATAAAIRQMAPTLTVVSAERIAAELRQLLVHPRRAQGMDLLCELGLAEPILPELVPLQGPLWNHVLRVLGRLPEPSFALALAALLCNLGAGVADEIGRRLKLSNDERVRTRWLVEKYQYLREARQLRTSQLKVLLAHPGIGELLALHRADAQASGRGTEHVEYCESLLGEWGPAELNPPPLLTGHDLTELGLEPGPRFKRFLETVREAQLDGTIEARPQALELIARLRAQDAG